MAAGRRTRAGFSPSRPPLTLGPGDSHDWDPPTFAERQLVAPAFDAERNDNSGNELIAPVFALSLPVFEKFHANEYGQS